MKQDINFIKEQISFAQIPNEVLNDKSISWKAKGLFAYIFSKPDNYDFSVRRIQLDSTDQVSATRKGIKELEDHGYIYRRKHETGRSTYYIGRKSFILQVLASSESPEFNKCTMQKVHGAKTAPISNTNHESNKDSYIASKQFKPPSILEIETYIKDKTTGNLDEATKIWYFYDSKGWLIGKTKMKNWKSAVSGWINRNKAPSTTNIPKL